MSVGPDSSAVCAHVLGQMEQRDIVEIIKSKEFPLVSYCKQISLQITDFI